MLESAKVEKRIIESFEPFSLPFKILKPQFNLSTLNYEVLFTEAEALQLYDYKKNNYERNKNPTMQKTQVKEEGIKLEDIASKIAESLKIDVNYRKRNNKKGRHEETHVITFPLTAIEQLIKKEEAEQIQKEHEESQRKEDLNRALLAKLEELTLDPSAIRPPSAQEQKRLIVAKLTELMNNQNVWKDAKGSSNNKDFSDLFKVEAGKTEVHINFKKNAISHPYALNLLHRYMCEKLNITSTHNGYKMVGIKNRPVMHFDKEQVLNKLMQDYKRDFSVDSVAPAILFRPAKPKGYINHIPNPNPNTHTPRFTGL